MFFDVGVLLVPFEVGPAVLLVGPTVLLFGVAVVAVLLLCLVVDGTVVDDVLCLVIGVVGVVFFVVGVDATVVEALVIGLD